MKLPKYYNSGKDEFQDVTQEWINDAQKAIASMGLQKMMLKRILEINPHHDKEKLIKISQFMLTLES